MNESASLLHDATFMRAILELVIPPSEDGRLPGAGSLGLAGNLAGQIEADPILGPVVQAGLAAVQVAAMARDPGGLAALPPAARLEVVESELSAQPQCTMGILRYLYVAYYAHPRVLEGLGEPARPPFPQGYELEPTDPGLLATLGRRRRP